MAGDIPIEERLVIAEPERRGFEAELAPGSAAQDGYQRVLHRYGERVLIVEPDPDQVRGEASGSRATDYAVPQSLPENLNEIEALGVSAFELRKSTSYREAKQRRPGQGQAWNIEGGCAAVAEAQAPEAMREARAGAPPTSAYLEGSVAVGVIIVEGPRAELQFSEAERTQVVAEVQNGLSWYPSVDLQGGLTFAYDIRVVRLDVASDAPAANNEARFRDPAMGALGFDASWNGVFQYVEDNRRRFRTRWTYCVFFTKYPVDHFAYASMGGPRIVMHYDNDGWGPGNIDRVFAHETGHIFGAPDEYRASGCDCGGWWGRWGKPNVNCETCAPGGGVSCIMRANDWALCPVTSAHLGWMAARGVAKHSGKAMDIQGGSTGNGARLLQWSFHGGQNQQFFPDPVGGGYYRLVALHSQKVLDVYGASAADGAEVIQWPWHGGDNQRFRIEPLGDGYARIIAKHSGKAFDVYGGSIDNGARIIQWPWHGGNNQRWLLTAPSVAKHSGRVLDIAGGSTANGAQLTQWDYHGGGNQIFRAEALGGGYFRFVVQNSGRVLDVYGGSTENGAQIIQWDWHGGNNQQFSIQPLGDGHHRIMARHSGKAFDVYGGSTDNGARIIQWPWHGGNNQRWLVPRW